MADTSNARNALARRQAEQEGGGPGSSLATLINTLRPEIARALPKHMSPDRMARVATTLMRQTPRLAEVTPPSFLGALMTCSQLGLEPGPLGLAWIIPRERRDNGRPTGIWEAHFQLGYKGAIELARRSGQLAKITARTVYAREVAEGRFTVEYDGASETIRHQPILIGERGEPVLYYAVARLTSGEEIFTPLRPDEVESRHRRRAQASPNSPAWTNDYQAMAWKSCVVEMRRWLPQSPELEQAIAADGRVRTDLDPSVLDEPAPADWESTAEEVPDQGEESATPPPAKARKSPPPADADPPAPDNEGGDWPPTAQPGGEA